MKKETTHPAGIAGQLTDDEIECALSTLAEFGRGDPDLSGPQKDIVDRVVKLAKELDE